MLARPGKTTAAALWPPAPGPTARHPPMLSVSWEAVARQQQSEKIRAKAMALGPRVGQGIELHHKGLQRPGCKKPRSTSRHRCKCSCCFATMGCLWFNKLPLSGRQQQLIRLNTERDRDALDVVQRDVPGLALHMHDKGSVKPAFNGQRFLRPALGMAQRSHVEAAQGRVDGRGAVGAGGVCGRDLRDRARREVPPARPGQ